MKQKEVIWNTENFSSNLKKIYPNQ